MAAQNMSPQKMASKDHNRRRFSPLTLRIFVIVIFPTAMFLIGLLHLDQYRQTVLQSEIDALYRQGNTLARTIGLADSEYSELAQRKISSLTLQRASQLIASIPDARIRIFQPDGLMISDSARAGSALPRTTLTPRLTEDLDLMSPFRKMVGSIAKALAPPDNYPFYQEKPVQSASDFPAVLNALSGEPGRLIMRDRKGKLILGVAVPIRHLRVVRGALLVTASGAQAEADIRAVQQTFIQIFLGIMVVTIGLGVYLARSIIGPISQLARAADDVRQSSGQKLSLPKMMDRRDEIGDLARDLAAMTDELQTRMQATASFAADVSHEIKNPLTSLRSAVETIARIDDRDQQKKLMNILLEDVKRLDRLITDISAASRLDADLSVAEFTRVDLCELFRNFVASRRMALGDDRVHFNVSLPDEPVFADIAVDRIVQVLDNLFANAKSFSPEGGEINLALEQHENKAVVTMSDQGPGIPEGKLEAVFDRFYSERPKEEKFGQHSGLGLSISRHIVEVHGGRLTASNIGDAKKGGPSGTRTGARMTMSLPISHVQEPDPVA
ncbi:stimulus-sensing domain-containing protein [Alphaproteobacteria bacterium LSUCC0684]